MTPLPTTRSGEYPRRAVIEPSGQTATTDPVGETASRRSTSSAVDSVFSRDSTTNDHRSRAAGERNADVRCVGARTAGTGR